MLKTFKAYLKKLVIKIINDLEQDHSTENNPFNINFYKHSKLGKPFKIENGSKINIGESSYIGKNAWLAVYNTSKSDSGIFIKNNVVIGNYSCITAVNKITINEGSLISEYFYTSDHSHGFDPLSDKNPVSQPLFSKGDVCIGKKCFIGYRVTILPGVCLGDNCVVGAHSVVTTSFPDHCMLAGVPAKLIKKFSVEKREWINVED